MIRTHAHVHESMILGYIKFIHSDIDQRIIDIRYDDQNTLSFIDDLKDNNNDNNLHLLIICNIAII